jgi:hypothetical protein
MQSSSASASLVSVLRVKFGTGAFAARRAAERPRCFRRHDPPSTLPGVAALDYPDQLVEVEAVAVANDGLVWP